MREKREGGEGTALDKIQKELLNSSFGFRGSLKTRNAAATFPFGHQSVQLTLLSSGSVD